VNSRSFRGVARLVGVPARESSCTTRGDAARVVLLRFALFPAALEAEGAFSRVTEPFGDAGAGVSRHGEAPLSCNGPGVYEGLSATALSEARVLLCFVFPADAVGGGGTEGGGRESRRIETDGGGGGGTLEGRAVVTSSSVKPPAQSAAVSSTGHGSRAAACKTELGGRSYQSRRGAPTNDGGGADPRRPGHETTLAAKTLQDRRWSQLRACTPTTTPARMMRAVVDAPPFCNAPGAVTARNGFIKKSFSARSGTTALSFPEGGTA